MVRPHDQYLAQLLERRLRDYSTANSELIGVREAKARISLVEQLIESVRRVRYVETIQKRPISILRANPNSILFDPVKAAILLRNQGQYEEAFWMVFLFVHFGKHRRGGWRYARDIYGRLGGSGFWDWSSVSADPAQFRLWLSQYQETIRFNPLPGGFGNHRKYQSLDAYSGSGTGAAFESYVRWVNPPRTHQALVAEAYTASQYDSRQAFRRLYDSMGSIMTFGRTARFDYLTMLAKLDLAPITADSAYIQQSTGPIAGARLLFGSGATPAELDRELTELGDYLGVDMQVIEDALCNWQKSPLTFRPFRG